MLNGDRKPRNKEAREASRNQVGYDLDSYQSVLSPRLTCQTHFFWVAGSFIKFIGFFARVLLAISDISGRPEAH